MIREFIIHGVWIACAIGGAVTAGVLFVTKVWPA